MTADKLSRDSLKRMKTMVRTNDGFEISEVDLQLRGPGDLMGTQQSGDLNLKIANLGERRWFGFDCARCSERDFW